MYIYIIFYIHIYTHMYSVFEFPHRLISSAHALLLRQAHKFLFCKGAYPFQYLSEKDLCSLALAFVVPALVLQSLLPSPILLEGRFWGVG